MNCSHRYPGVPVSERQFRVTGLHSNTSYRLAVRCRGKGAGQGAGQGAWLCSPEVAVTTLGEDADTSPRYSHLKQV